MPSDTFENRFRTRLARLNLPYHWELILFGFTSRQWIIDGDKAKSDQKKDYNAIKEKADKWCEERISRAGDRWEDFSIHELADGIGESFQVTKNLFQIILSKDFRVWKMEKRIALAVNLLKNLECIGISTVARRAGFKDMSNFSRQFRRITGHSPSEMKSSPYAP